MTKKMYYCTMYYCYSSRLLYDGAFNVICFLCLYMCYCMYIYRIVLKVLC